MSGMVKEQSPTAFSRAVGMVAGGMTRGQSVKTLGVGKSSNHLPLTVPKQVCLKQDKLQMQELSLGNENRNDQVCPEERSFGNEIGNAVQGQRSSNLQVYRTPTSDENSDTEAYQTRSPTKTHGIAWKQVRG